MRSPWIGLASLVATVALATTAQTLTYPTAARGDVSSDYYSVKVPDPYRWMEDIDSPATRTWVEAEDKLSRDYLAALPGRAAIAARRSKPLTIAKRKPPGGMAWASGARSSWKVICTLVTPAMRLTSSTRVGGGCR